MANAPVLSRFPLFDVLGEEEKAELESLLEFQTHPKYNYIFLPGSPADSIYLMTRGCVKIGTYFTDGREAIKKIEHAPAIFGELVLTHEVVRQDFAISMNKEVHLYALKAEDFKKVMQRNQELQENVLNLIGMRLREVECRLESLIFKDARARIIDFLKTTAHSIGRKVGYEMYFKHALTQQDIANITDTSRQTVTLVLNDLRKSNLIHFNRNSFLIRDLEKLI